MNLTICDSVEALVSRVETETGKPVRWIQAPDMPTMVEVRPARKKDEDHLIYISGGFRDPEGQHLIACKCYQILRLGREKEEDRLMPVAGQEQFNNARMRLASDAGSRPDLAKALNEDEIVQSWVFGVINQLVSQPADIHIQKAVREELPELKEAQQQVLDQQVRDFQAAMSEEVKRFSPKVIYDASLIMNGVYLHLLDRLMGTDFVSRVEPLPQSRKIERLLEASLAVLEDSPAGDRRLTETWADFLTIRDWFEWAPFEDVPDEY